MMENYSSRDYNVGAFDAFCSERRSNLLPGWLFGMVLAAIYYLLGFHLVVTVFVIMKAKIGLKSSKSAENLIVS